MVKFDEKIFVRKVCLRPIPDWELEGVDPFALDPDAEVSGEQNALAPSTGPGCEDGGAASMHFDQASLVFGDLLHVPRDYGRAQACGKGELCRARRCSQS
jgi:hypothetical protein